ncbi:MAG TPA: DNA glycosylase [Methanospirillum sp.]|nr:DNA glycosylase [Methanospirillum sp.]
MKSLHLTSSQTPFDLDLSLSCGQIFGWKKTGDMWKGVHNGKIITIRQERDSLQYEGADKREIIRFLGLHDPIQEIITSIRDHIIVYNSTPDPFFETQYARSQGLRILRQHPWECLVSFICSANSNIRTIEKRINLILGRYGRACHTGEHQFPDPKTLSQCREDRLRECLTGYRAPYLIKTAAYICNHPDFFEQVAMMEYTGAKKALMTLPGVGPKVADCVLLFAFEHLSAVPVDIRIRTIIEKRYADLIKTEKKGRLSYDTISGFCREYFGPYAGYAQQYLFATRDMEKQRLPDLLNTHTYKIRTGCSKRNRNYPGGDDLPDD